MIIPLILITGIVGSIVAQSYLPVVASLVMSVGFYELLLHDIHNHVAHLEEHIHG